MTDLHVNTNSTRGLDLLLSAIDHAPNRFAEVIGGLAIEYVIYRRAELERMEAEIAAKELEAAARAACVRSEDEPDPDVLQILWQDGSAEPTVVFWNSNGAEYPGIWVVSVGRDWRLKKDNR